MAEVTVNIEGMTCQHCVGKVKQALDALPGVQEAEVEIGSAKVTFNGSVVNRNEIADAVVRVGYPVVG